MAKNLESRVAELEANMQRSDAVVSVMGKELEELRKYIEEFDVAMEKHKKEMAEMKMRMRMRMREVLAKKLTVDEFKASKEY